MRLLTDNAFLRASERIKRSRFIMFFISNLLMMMFVYTIASVQLLRCCLKKAAEVQLAFRRNNRQYFLR